MGKLTKEEEVLLSSCSSGNSNKASALFYINAAVIASAPIYLFYGIHQLDAAESWIIWAISAIAGTYLLQFATKNQKNLFKHSVLLKRGTAVDREISQKYANDKKMTTKEKEERALFRKNEVADSEATYLSIFFVNVLFLTILFVLAFFAFANVNPLFHTLLSIVGASGIVAFLSTSKN